MEYRVNLDGYSKAEPFFLVFTHNKTLTLESRASPKPTRMSHLQIFKASRGESEEEEGRVLGLVIRVSENRDSPEGSCRASLLHSLP